MLVVVLDDLSGVLEVLVSLGFVVVVVVLLDELDGAGAPGSPFGPGAPGAPCGPGVAEGTATG